MPLLLAMDRRLLREAFEVLIRNDDRFALRLASDSSWLVKASKQKTSQQQQACVVLVDGGFSSTLVRRLVKAYRPLGGVMLTELEGSSAEEDQEFGPIRVGKVELAVLDYECVWDEVAKALLLASKGVISPRPYRTTKANGAESDSSQKLSDELKRYQLLSKREKEVLKGIGMGYSLPQIARRLDIALSTAENHKSRLMKKIGIHKSLQLVRFAIRIGAAPV